MGAAYVHVGVSRTATTTLQQNVFERLEGIHYLGKPGPHERDRAVAGFSKPKSALLERTLKSLVTGINCPRDDVKTLRAVIEKLKTSDAPVIFSNELLCENKYVSFADIAAGISDIFGPSELIITVRGSADGSAVGISARNDAISGYREFLHEMARRCNFQSAPHQSTRGIS